MTLSHTYSRGKDSKGKNTDKITYDYYNANSITHEQFLLDDWIATTRTDIDFDSFEIRGSGNADKSYHPNKDKFVDMGGGDDDVRFTGYQKENQKDLLVFLGSGDDLIKINQPGRSSNFTHIFAGSGNDTILAKDRDGVSDRKIDAYGGTGDDFIQGADGDDALWGEADNDTIMGGRGHDIIIGGSGNDLLNGERGNDKISGGTGDDTLYGGSGEDTLYGVSGNNFIDAGEGSDTVYGSSGNDIISPGERTGEDTDVIYSGSGRDIIFSGGLLPTNIDELRNWSQSSEIKDAAIEAVFQTSVGFISAANGYVGAGIVATMGLIDAVKAGNKSRPKPKWNQDDYTIVKDFDPTQDVMVVNSLLPSDNITNRPFDISTEGGVLTIRRDSENVIAKLEIDSDLVSRLQSQTGHSEAKIKTQLVRQTEAHGTYVAQSGNNSFSSAEWAQLVGSSANIAGMDSDWTNQTVDNLDDALTGDDAILLFGATGNQVVDTSLYNSEDGLKIAVGRTDENNVFLSDGLNDSGYHYMGTFNLTMVGGEKSDLFHIAGNRGNKKVYGDGGTDTLLLSNAKFLAQTNGDPKGYKIDLSVQGEQAIRRREIHRQSFETPQEWLTVQGVENIVGSAESDELTGDNAANQFFGGGGNDILDGGGGNDTLEGGLGEDTYVFAGSAFGQDVITDFDSSQEKIRFTNNTVRIDANDNEFGTNPAFSSFAQMHSNTSNDGNGNAIIRYDRGSITLKGVSKSELKQTNFEFEENRFSASNIEDLYTPAAGSNDILTPISSNWNLIGAGDFNGDGTDDVLWQNQNGRVHTWQMQNGEHDSSYYIGHSVGSDWSLVGAGDFNGDGTDDLLFQHQNGQVHAWEVRNGQRVSGYNIHTPVGSNWTLVGAGDFNGDGTDDVLFQHQGGQVHAWEVRNGQRVSGYHIHTPVGSNWTLMGAGDFDGNGTDDLLFQHQNGQAHAWSIRNGQRVSGYNIHAPLGSSQNLIGAGDFNRDGTSDILIQQSNGQVSSWDGTFF